MYYEGILIGLIAFLAIGLFHPLIVKGEYHFSHDIWPSFLCAGLTGLAGAVIVRNTLISSALGVFGFSALWSIGELFKQRERVRKGWFPAKNEAELAIRSSVLPKTGFTGRTIGETVFDILYLTVILIIAAIICSQPGKRIYGLACMALFIGDACHLLPRMYALAHGGVDKHPKSVGMGKFITSVTMSVFYYLLAPNIYTLVLLWARIALCLSPFNKWSSNHTAPITGVVRNIPLLATGLVAASILGFPYAVAILVSFLFYVPVVLFAHKMPSIGVLMIPKSCAYVALLILLAIG
jgi:hypothetical protein